MQCGSDVRCHFRVHSRNLRKKLSKREKAKLTKNINLKEII